MPTSSFTTSDDTRAQLALSCLAPRLFPQLRLPRLFSSSSSPVIYDLPSEARLAASHQDKPLDLTSGLSSVRTQLKDHEETVLYLAYGSNLCHETFQGRRGIKPLAAINVVVPSLRLTFDLPGMPYLEPCFANSGPRDVEKDLALLEHGSTHKPLSATPTTTQPIYNEKSPLLPRTDAPSHPPYHKDAWHKGLVGIVYELTPSDYAHVIATEGGGASYHDILIDCYALDSDPNVPVPTKPSTPAFKAHTLYAPPHAPPPPKPQPPVGAIYTASSSADNNDSDNPRFTRPDPSYAQPSSRYLKLITDGAAEHSLPTDYRLYLSSIRPYIASTVRQRMGAFIFTSIWAPLIAFIFAMNGFFQDEQGRSPGWLARLQGALFGGVWECYDRWAEGVFGDGERTVGDGGRDDGGEESGEGEVDRDEEAGRVLERAKTWGLVGEEREGGPRRVGNGGDDGWDEKLGR